MTYPVKFRKKLISVMEKEKLKIEEAAIRFDVGSASVSRWKVNPEPKLTRNRPAQKIDMEALKKDVELNPDSFIYERAERFSVSNSGRRYALKQLGISRKKKPKAIPKADAQLRVEFETKIGKYKSEGKSVGYVDESGFSHQSTRSHAVSLFSFNINSDIFHAWMTQDLLPKVPAGSVIVMDNASFHKREDIAQSIHRAGCIVEFLPPYSPDLNPIEHSWFQIKSIRNNIRCSVEELFSHSITGHLFMVL